MSSPLHLNPARLTEITLDDFLKIDIRVGTVLSAEVFKEARKPAYILKIDFGSTLGIKKSSAQIANNYTPEELVGQQVMAVVNLPTRQIGPIQSEVLTLGFPDEEGRVVLAGPKTPVPSGVRLY